MATPRHLLVDPPRAVVAIEAHVDGETMTFDMDEVGSRSPSEDGREEAAQEDPCHVATEAPEAKYREESSSPETGPEEASPARPRRRPRPHVTLTEYIDLVRAMAEADAGRSADRPGGLSRWLARAMVLRKRQRSRRASLDSRAHFPTPVSAQARVFGGGRPAAACDRQQVGSHLLRVACAPPAGPV